MTEPVVVSWSGGKDSALALGETLEDPRYEVVALLTTLTSTYDRVSVHGVRRWLLHAQARALGIPVREVWIEPACTNEAYEAAFTAAVTEMRGAAPGLRRVVFGDLFLRDVREYRERMLAPLGIEAVFPIWGRDTAEVARGFVARGFAATLSCVDTHALPAEFAGRAYDADLLRDLPPGVDPCGERGEFHTFVSHGPGFRAPIPHVPGEVVLRDGRFAFCDLLEGEGGPVERAG